MMYLIKLLRPEWDLSLMLFLLGNFFPLIDCDSHDIVLPYSSYNVLETI